MCYLSNTALAGLAVAGLTIAAPTVKRSYTINDGIILNYALTLEYLERAFYREGTSKYDDATFVSAGFPQPFHDNLLEIYSDEQTHVSFLSEALTNANITPTVELQYSFPVGLARSVSVRFLTRMVVYGPEIIRYPRKCLGRGRRLSLFGSSGLHRKSSVSHGCGFNPYR